MTTRPTFELSIPYSGHPYIELLSAAFQIPSFLIAKIHVEGSTYERLTSPIYERILTNWLAANSESIIAHDMDQLRDASGFLSALAAGMRDNLYRMRRVEKSTGYSMRCHSRWVNDLHQKIMGEWLVTSPITGLTLLGTRWHQFLQEGTQHGCIDSSMSNEDFDQRSRLAWSFIQTDEQGVSFRKIYAQTIARAASDN